MFIVQAPKMTCLPRVELVVLKACGFDQDFRSLYLSNKLVFAGSLGAAQQDDLDIVT